MANSEDPTLPNWQKTEEQANKEGWFMVDDDPTIWKHKNGKVIKGVDHKPKKSGGK